MKKLMIAAALIVASGTANAAVFDVILAEDGFAAGNPGSPAGNYDLTGNVDAPATDATWTYDDVTGLLQGTGILTAGIQPFGGFNPIFSHTMNDPMIQGGVASATAYHCITGPFGFIVGSQVCGNYGLGDNGEDDSVFFYDLAATDGRTFTRMVMPDDVDEGADGVQTLAFMDMSVVQFDGPGGLLVLQTADWLDTPEDSAGAQLTFSVAANVIPIPAAVWLFGSALGLLGWVRRRGLA